MFVAYGNQGVVRGLRDPDASDTDLLVTYIFAKFFTGIDGNSDFYRMQPYKINVLTLEKIEKLQGKWKYTSLDPLLVYDADKLFEFYESITDTSTAYDITDLEFTVSLTGAVTNTQSSVETIVSGSETKALIDMPDFYQSVKNIRSDLCLCFGILNDQLACTQNFSFTKCEYETSTITVTSLVIVEVGSSSYDFQKLRDKINTKIDCFARILWTG
jgi:hypothetical protein